MIVCLGGSHESIKAAMAFSNAITQDTVGKHMLLNGRIWRNQYSKVTGDQFFMTDKYIKGSVSFNGSTFKNLDLKYDIYNDELILSIESYPVIFMNKEIRLTASALN